MLAPRKWKRADQVSAAIIIPITAVADLSKQGSSQRRARSPDCSSLRSVKSFSFARQGRSNVGHGTRRRRTMFRYCILAVGGWMVLLKILTGTLSPPRPVEHFSDGRQKPDRFNMRCFYFPERVAQRVKTMSACGSKSCFVIRDGSAFRHSNSSVVKLASNIVQCNPCCWGFFFLLNTDSLVFFQAVQANPLWRWWTRTA